MLNTIKNYFNFSKKELNGVLVLCILIVVVSVAPGIYSFFNKSESHDFAEFDKEVAKFYASEKASSAPNYSRLKNEIEDKEAAFEYFRFNPNGLDISSWKRLGLSDRQIRVIKNYESKGGRFFKKEDLKKIYSISNKDYARLEPYIMIPDRYPKNKQKRPDASGSARRTEVSTPKVIEINSADSAQLEGLKGIGPAFASRIYRYRDRLGGFYSKSQLREVYGIDSLKYAEIKDQIDIDPSSVKKININTAVFDDLKRHPYLSYKQMNAIIQYRKQHGSYTSINDLKKIVILNEEILRKIEPYIQF